MKSEEALHLKQTKCKKRKESSVTRRDMSVVLSGCDGEREQDFQRATGKAELKANIHFYEHDLEMLAVFQKSSSKVKIFIL